jgi:osmoprotectant transport system permease protein
VPIATAGRSTPRRPGEALLPERSEAAGVSYLLKGSNWALSQPMNIPSLILSQLSMTLVSVIIGLAIAFPLAFLVSISRPSHRPIFNPARYYGPLIAGTGVLYTIPSLAFMAFLVPWTGLNPATIIIPLVVYTQLVLIRNIVAARHAVDPTLVDVGRAMGMNGFQLQRYVVLPLSLPLIVAGLRVVTVTTIGIATFAPLIGVEDIGTLIFQGFNFSYNDEIIAGVIVVSVLAIAADLLLLAIQRLLSRGQRIVPAA